MPCFKYHLTPYCKFGESCKSSHEPITSEQREALRAQAKKRPCDLVRNGERRLAAPCFVTGVDDGWHHRYGMSTPRVPIWPRMPVWSDLQALQRRCESGSDVCSGVRLIMV